MPQGHLAAHPLEQRAEPLPGPRIDDHPVLRRADDEPVALFPTAAEIFIDVGLAIADAHPADVVACRGRPDPRRGAFPGTPVLRGLDRLVGDLDLGATGVGVDTRWMRGPDVGLLIEQPQDLDARPMAAVVGSGRPGPADGEHRVELEGFLPLGAVADRPQAGDRLSPAVRDRRRVLDQEILSRLAHLVADQAAMAGLDVVGGGFGVVEHVVRGPHVIPAGEQPRDAPARVGRHGGGDDPDPPVPRRVCERGAGEMGVGPGLRFGVGDDQVQGADADKFEDPEGGPRGGPGHRW